jgi:hypothetical protein
LGLWKDGKPDEGKLCSCAGLCTFSINEVTLPALNA